MSGRPPILAIFDGVTWVPIPQADLVLDDDLPFATHHGVLEIPGLGSARCYRLSNGDPVFHAEDLEAIFGGPDAPAEVQKLFRDTKRQQFRLPPEAPDGSP